MGDRIYFKSKDGIEFYEYTTKNNRKIDLKQILEIDSVNYTIKENDIILGKYQNYKSPFSNNSLNIFNRCYLNDIDNFKHYKIYNTETIEYDKMLECLYKDINNNLVSLENLMHSLRKTSRLLCHTNLIFLSNQYGSYSFFF